MASRPPLYRIWRILSLLATLVVVAVVVITALAVYGLVSSAVGGLPKASGPGASGPTVRLAAALTGSTLVESLALPFPNHGYFAIVDLSAAGTLVNRSNGTVAVGTLGAPSATIQPGKTSNLTLTARVDLAGAGGLYLTTHNGTLGSDLWLNWSYAYLYGFSVRVNFSLPWAPPFANLTYVASGLTAEPNGTHRAALGVAFANAVPNLTLSGTLHATVYDPSGAPCGTAVFPILSGTGPVVGSETVWLAAGCPTTGDVVESVFSSNSDPLSLPTEPLG